MTNSKRYPAEVFFSEEDEGFIALARDLPGCSAFGETQEAALAELQHAIYAWHLAALAAGNPVPEPSKPAIDSLPSGKILLRIPRSLHAKLIDAAKHEAVSLNQHLVSVLSGAATITTLTTTLTTAMSRLAEVQGNAAAQFELAQGQYHLHSFVGANHLGQTKTGRTVSPIKFSTPMTAIQGLLKETSHG